MSNRAAVNSWTHLINTHTHTHALSSVFFRLYIVNRTNYIVSKTDHRIVPREIYDKLFISN